MSESAMPDMVRFIEITPLGINESGPIIARVDAQPTERTVEGQIVTVDMQILSVPLNTEIIGDRGVYTFASGSTFDFEIISRVSQSSFSVHREAIIRGVNVSLDEMCEMQKQVRAPNGISMILEPDLDRVFPCRLEPLPAEEIEAALQQSDQSVWSLVFSWREVVHLGEQAIITGVTNGDNWTRFVVFRNNSTTLSTNSIHQRWRVEEVASWL